MKAAIRFFALFVAFAGLASASFAPANKKPLAAAANGADPTTINLPAPLPCQMAGTCFVSGSQAR